MDEPFSKGTAPQNVPPPGGRSCRILGIDPGTRFVGYGMVEKRANALVYLAGGCIQAEGDTIAQRLVTIHRGLCEVVKEHRPDTAAVETVFTGHNPKTAIAIGEGRGVALLSIAENGVEVKGYAPALVKRSVTGSGRADKDQVRAMVQALLCLPALPATDHEADALALAITHARHISVLTLTGGGCLPDSGAAGRRAGRRFREVPEWILRQLPPGISLK